MHSYPACWRPTRRSCTRIRPAEKPTRRSCTRIRPASLLVGRCRRRRRQTQSPTLHLRLCLPAGRALREAALRFYAAARVARYEAGGSAAQLEINAVPPLRNDGEFPRLGAGAPIGPAGAGARRGLGGPGPMGAKSGDSAGRTILSGTATSCAYRATGRQAPAGGPARSGILRSCATQISSDGDPTGNENRTARLAVGTTGESPAL